MKLQMHNSVDEKKSFLYEASTIKATIICQFEFTLQFPGTLLI